MPAGVGSLSLTDLATGNKQAMAVASRSRLAMAAHQAVLDIARGLPDEPIRRATLDVLANPSSRVHLASPSAADKAAVRQDLLDAGLISDSVPVEGIFPTIVDVDQAPQAFWSAPGSTYTGHHAYPGGLAVHEWLNARIAKAFVEGYDAIYHLSSDPKAIDASIAQAAPLWHDIHKVTVFQWRADSSELVEYPIADTGAHHPLSGAEAILRGLPLPFVIALLSAHDAPTTVKSNSTQTGLQRLVNYVRAAAIIARRDPVALGLLQRASDGSFQLSQNPPRIEGHINHLSDHDYLFSNDSAATLIGTLRQVAVDYGIDPARQEPRFNCFATWCSRRFRISVSTVVLQTSGRQGLKVVIDREVMERVSPEQLLVERRPLEEVLLLVVVGH